MTINGHKLIFKTLTGSQSYGTAIPESDMDYKGVYIQDPKDVYVNGYKEQIDVTKDEVYYEIGRFLSLCATGNPTMLELLFAPADCILYIDSVFEEVIKIRDVFLTKALRHSFGGYAIEQIKKAGGLQKKMNWEKQKTERKTVVEMCNVYPFEYAPGYQSIGKPLEKWLVEMGYYESSCGLVKLEHFRDCYLLFQISAERLAYAQAHGDGEIIKVMGITSGDNANEVCVSEIPKYMTPTAILFFNRDAYSIHCKEYKEYTDWLAKRNVQRYVDFDSHGQQLDGKNILHCVRLIETALEIPVQKTINVRRPNAAYLIEIRRGKHDLKTLLDKCERDIEIMNSQFANSDLPDKVNRLEIDKLITRIRTDYYNQAELHK